MAFDLKDYVDVAERVREFYVRFPQGSLQSEITHLSDKLVVVKAWAYRSPDDDRPAIGHSSLSIPGSTPYTKGSEIENAETSAWGRALAGLGFATKAIASREEVQNKQQPAPDKWAEGAHTFVATAMEKFGVTERDVFLALEVANGDELIEKAQAAKGWNPLATAFKKAMEAK